MSARQHMDNHAIISGDRRMGININLNSADDSWMDITRSFRKKGKEKWPVALS